MKPTNPFRIIAASFALLVLAACGNANNIASNGLYSGVGGVVGGCQTLTSVLSFSAQGASVSNTQILAGNLPASSGLAGPHGTVAMGGGYAMGLGVGVSVTDPTAGTLSLNVNNGAALTGTIQLNQSLMMGLSQYGCVSSLAINAVWTPSFESMTGVGYINQALVWLIFQNGQPYGPIAFY